ncbi:MAG: acyltransferase [Actinomycetota bacterium]
MQTEAIPRPTTSSRDRYVDLLRAFSLAVVVVGHWFLALIWWSDGRIGVHNVVGPTSGLWPLTWVVQAMPLFFFVGGISNFETFRTQISRGRTSRRWLALRAERLLGPLLAFAAAWGLAETALHLLGLGGGGLIRGSFLPFVPVWLLLIFLGVRVATPAMLWLHQRAGAWVPFALAVLAAVVDLLRFWPNVPAVGWLNLALVWLFAHQLGFFYADGSLVRAGPRVHTSMTLGGLLALLVLTNLNVYPRSMVGTDLEAVSNMNPPTLCIVALTLSLVGAALLLRQRAKSWLERERAWVTLVANARIITIYLWHLTAYLLAILALYPLGLGRPSDGTLSWWLQRPLWVVVPAVFLGLLVFVFGRFERVRLPSTRTVAEG